MKQRKSIPLSEPHIEGNAWKYVKQCLDTNWVSSAGSFVNEFERRIAEYTGARFAVAGVNGTACLHAVLNAVGISSGDGVIVPALTFIATANAVSYCGAKTIILDCDPDRFNLDLDGLEDFLENQCVLRRGTRYTRRDSIPVRAVLAVHALGYPLDLDRLRRVTRRHGLILIEDAAESTGTFWKGRHTGTSGAAGVMSFNGNKIITSGGGGMIITDDAQLARQLKHRTQQAKIAGTEYLHDVVGFNYRMSNVLAALGVSQLELLPSFLRKRSTIAKWYRKCLPGVPVAPYHTDTQWNRWLLSVQVATRPQKVRLLRELNAAGCQARPLWVPLTRQRPYRRSVRALTPNATHAYATVINIPSSTSLTETDVRRVANILEDFPLRRLLV